MESISISDDIMIETFLSFIKTGHRGFLTIL